MTITIAPGVIATLHFAFAVGLLTLIWPAARIVWSHSKWLALVIVLAMLNTALEGFLDGLAVLA